MKMRVKNPTALGNKGKDLREFAGNYLSKAFPNPDRDGCPSDSALRSLAFNPKESQPSITEHLAACSPCFRRYSEFLAELKAQREAEKRFSWGRIFAWTRVHPVLVGTAAVCALLIAIGAGLLFRRSRLPNTPPVETHRTPASVEPLNSAVAYARFGLDLSALSRVRGSESSATVPQRLAVPSSPLDLTLTLPLASKEGPYDLRVTSGDRTFWSKSAQAHLLKGKTVIQVEADFRQVPTGNYNLEVQSSSGIRLIQPLFIAPGLPHSEKPE